MKTLFAGSLILLVFVSNHIYAQTPTETLKLAVDKILVVAGDKALSEEDKRKRLSEVLQQEVDFEAVSKRVVSKSWKEATEKQQIEFKALFLDVMVGTYTALLSNYSNEKVEFKQEQTKGNKYAVVDTVIISDNKKIPVRYRLIKDGDSWRIYDFIPEGVSLVSTYKTNYGVILNKQGVSGLLEEMKKAAQPSESAEKPKDKSE